APPPGASSDRVGGAGFYEGPQGCLAAPVSVLVVAIVDVVGDILGVDDLNDLLAVVDAHRLETVEVLDGVALRIGGALDRGFGLCGGGSVGGRGCRRGGALLAAVLHTEGSLHELAVFALPVFAGDAQHHPPLVLLVQVERVVAQGLHHSEHQGDDDEHEWGGRDNRDALQVIERVRIAGGQHDHRDGAGENTPQDGDDRGCNEAATLGHAAHHRGGGVRRGDEEGSQQQHRDDGHARTEWVLVQQVEQHLGGITVAPDGLAGLLEVDSSTAEDGEPQDRHGGRDEQDHHNELANRAAAGSTRQYHTHERGPGDPPCAVEDGPGRQTVTSGLGALAGAGGDGEEVLQVVTQGRRDHVHDDDGRADNKDEQGHDPGQHHVRIRDPLNTLAHAGCGGEQEGDAEHDNDADDQSVDGVIDPVDDLHARGNLAGTDTQGGSGPEDGGEDGQDVDELTEPALGEAVADQRDVRGAQQLLAPQAEGAVGD